MGKINDHLRKLIVRDLEDGEDLSIIAKKFDISVRTVRKILSDVVHGRTEAVKGVLGRPRTLLPAEIEYIKGIVEAEPDLHLAELQILVKGHHTLFDSSQHKVGHICQIYERPFL